MTRPRHEDKLRIPEGYEQIKVRGVTRWVPPVEDEEPVPPTTRQSLRDAASNPWVWGTIVRYGSVFEAFLLRNGDLCYDRNHVGRDRWDEWPMPSRRVRETWRRSRGVS